MDTLHRNVTNFFEEMLNDLKCQQDTKAYIVGIYSKYKSAEFDLSKDSVTSLYSQARSKRDFLTYQNLGDWIFFANTLAPAHLKFASKDFYDTIARLSYYSCYRILDRKWRCFEELADSFLRLEDQVKRKLEILVF